MIIDCVSDLHGFFPKLHGGDLLIVAGDCTTNDKDYSWGVFYNWLAIQKYEKKIYIAGNHDNRLGNTRNMTPKHCDAIYLCDSGTEFEGLKLWGTPWTTTFKGINPKCTAFTLENDQELAKKWELIPEDTDILITHSPPISILDKTINNKFTGSVSLSAKLGFLINIKLHVFGHIHESYGKIGPPEYLPNYFDVCKHYSINASHVNERYEPVNKPMRVIL